MSRTPFYRRAVTVPVLFAFFTGGIPAAPREKPSVAAPQAKPEAKDRGAELRGRVADADGKPVAKATVRILTEKAEEAAVVRARLRFPEPQTRLATGEDGTFEARGISGSSFTLRVEAGGYAPFTQKQVPAGASVKVSLKKGHSVTGLVRDLETRKPIAGATVVAWEPDASRFGEEACRQARSGEDGLFTIVDLPRGSVDLEARAPGRAIARVADVTVPQPPSEKESTVSDIELYLRPGGRLAGTVVGGDGKPIEGATVRLRSQEMNLRNLMREGLARPVTTDASGAFALEGLPVGRYQLTAEKKGLASTEAGPFEVRAGTDRGNLEIRLETGATLKVRVVDAEERPVHGLEVELLDSKQGSAPFRFGGREVDRDQIREGDDGKYTISNLDPGTYTIRLLPADWADVERENVKLKMAETTDLGSFVVREGRSLSGHVTDTAGSPIQGAEVMAFWNDESRMKNRQVRTKADGRYRLAGLGESPVSMISVRTKGFARAEREGAAPGDTVDFVLERTGSAVGRVVLPGGKVPTAFRVKAHPEARRTQEGMWRRFLVREQGGEQVFTDPTGSFRLDDLDPGLYTLEATTDAYAPAKKTGVQVVSEQVADAGTLTLEKGIGLRGRVLDAKDDSPLGGAVVRVELPASLPFRFESSSPLGNAVSASDGSFTIDGLQAGAHVVTVEHPDFSPSKGRVEIAADQEPPEFVARMSRGGILTGAVRDARGQPVADARVVIVQGMGEDMRSVVTGPDGRYLIERLSPGTYQVMRAPEGGRGGVLGLGMKSAAIREGETTTVDFDETPRISLNGRVLRGGEPLAGATLFFIGGELAAPGEIKSSRSEANGEYRVGLDSAGEYQVTVQTGGPGDLRGRSTIRLTVPEQPEVKQDIVLSARGITGRVTDGEGKGITGAFVTALRDGATRDDATRQAVTQSAGDGSFSVEGLEPGTYRVTATSPGYRLAEAHPVDVSEASPAPTVDLKLERGRALRGRVLDPQAHGLPGAMIYVTPSGAAESGFSLPSAQTDVNGAFEITAPSEGPVDITALPAGWAPARLVGITPPTEEGDGSEVILQATLGGKLRLKVMGPEGQPVAGVQIVLRPLPAFPGSDFALRSRRAEPTGPDGTTRFELMAPGVYEVSVAGRRDVPPVQVAVSEGAEAAAVIRIP